MKWFVLIKLDQQNRLRIVSRHLHALIVQPSGIQRTNQIRNRFAFHTNLWSQNIITYLEVNINVGDNSLVNRIF